MFLRLYGLCFSVLFGQTLFAGELLGHMSEDDLPATVSVPADSGRLIYRVICSPGQQDEPDCERAPLEDSFEALQSKAARDAQQAAEPIMPDLPAEVLPVAEPAVSKAMTHSKPKQAKARKEQHKPAKKSRKSAKH